MPRVAPDEQVERHAERGELVHIGDLTHEDATEGRHPQPG
jgi:hypothetical protein